MKFWILEAVSRRTENLIVEIGRTICEGNFGANFLAKKGVNTSACCNFAVFYDFTYRHVALLLADRHHAWGLHSFVLFYF